MVIHWFQRFSSNSMFVFCFLLLNDLSSALKYASVSDITSSLESNFFPWSNSLWSANSQWSLGAGSGELGGCRSNSKCESCSFAIVAINLYTLHCLVERVIFSFAFLAVFWWFLPLNASVCYIIFAIDGSSFLKIINEPCTSQNTEAKTLPADVCVFGRFGQLSTDAVHSMDCWFVSRVKCWIHISSIVTYLRKSSFLLHWNTFKQRSESSTHCCFWSTVIKSASNLNTAFSFSNVHAKWWIHCLLISSAALLSHTTSIYDWLKRVFLGQLPNIGALSIQHHLCLYDRV